jgi:hypothetical protein
MRKCLNLTPVILPTPRKECQGLTATTSADETEGWGCQSSTRVHRKGGRRGDCRARRCEARRAQVSASAGVGRSQALEDRSSGSKDSRPTWHGGEIEQSVLGDGCVSAQGGRGRQFRLRRLGSPYQLASSASSKQCCQLAVLPGLGTGVEPNSWREARAVTRLGGAVARNGQTQFTGAGDRGA